LLIKKKKGNLVCFNFPSPSLILPLPKEGEEKRKKILPIFEGEKKRKIFLL